MTKTSPGFQPSGKHETSDAQTSIAMNELKRLFRPEFLNRVDEICMFHSLEDKEIMNILNMTVKEVLDRLELQNIHLEISAKVKEYLIDKWYDVTYGARPLRRAVQKEIEDPLSMGILSGTYGAGSHISAEFRNGQIKFKNRLTKKALKT
jgi:ATP-dependent Clp protease ATP-binding subunit ClpC